MTVEHVIYFALVYGFCSLMFYYFRRKKGGNRQKNARGGVQPPPLPPIQTAVGVPVEHLPNPYPPYGGTLRINDPLRDNKAGYGWMDDSDSKKSTASTEGCHFCEDAYHITESSKLQPYMVYCLALQTNFSNFVYQIEAILLQGAEIGVIFRQTPGYRYYYFSVRRDGSYGLFWHAGEQSQLLKEGFSSAINTELNQPNVLAVVANGTAIDLYVNQQHLAGVTDTTYSAGRIGTATAADRGRPNDVAFKNLMLWTLD